MTPQKKNVEKVTYSFLNIEGEINKRKKLNDHFNLKKRVQKTGEYKENKTLNSNTQDTGFREFE